MRKLKLQMQISLDGYVAGPQGQMDFIPQEMDPKQLGLLKELTESMGTILLGRKMTEGFISYWENVVDTQPDSPEHPYAKIFVDTPKIMFSKTVNTIKGRNIRVENGDLVEAVTKLKKEKGKDIIVYGGANFVSELIKNKLIDELNLFVSPTALGTGLKIFTERSSFSLIESISYSSGVIALRYKAL